MSVDDLVIELEQRFDRLSHPLHNISKFDINREFLDFPLDDENYYIASRAYIRFKSYRFNEEGSLYFGNIPRYVDDLDRLIRFFVNEFAPSNLRTLSTINKTPKKKILYGLDLVKPSNYLSALVSQLSDPEKIYFFTGLFCKRTKISHSLQHKVAQFCEVGRNHLIKLHTNRKSFQIPELGTGDRHFGDVVLDYSDLLNDVLKYKREMKKAKRTLFGEQVLRGKTGIRADLVEARLQKQQFLVDLNSEERRMLTLVFGEKELGDYAINYNPYTIVP